MTLTELRFLHVEDAIDAAFPTVTMIQCMNFDNHVQQHFPAGLELRDLPVGV